METSLSDIKDLVTIAKPLIDPIISTFIKPKIDQLTKWLKTRSIENAVEDNFFEDKFQEYLARTLAHCENINVLIFQNQQVKLKDIYYPLKIESSKDNSVIHLTDFKAKHINKYKKILISDTAGMGKSTLTKFITLKAIENNIAIPILIELRNLKENHTVLDEIFEQINPVDKSFDKDLIIKFLELGNFLILFDGFDEINFKSQEAIIRDLRDFINKTSFNQFILTSRPEGSLASFGDFQLFNILQLKDDESYELIMKYDSICPVKVGNKLISDIKESFNETKELLGNPFLISLVYSTYTYNKDIPSSKSTFYEEIYSALFKRHDLSKDGWTRPKKSKLDIQQFKTILRQLAFDTAIAGTIVYSESEIIEYINITKKKCPGLDFSSSDFLDDILSPVPLFQKDGLKIKWAHKSIQDYFAADFIAFSSKKDEIIERIYNSQRDSFLNILDLFFDLDYKTFRNIIVEKLLRSFISHFENSYNEIDGVSNKEIKIRKTYTFDVTAYFFRYNDSENIQKAINRTRGILSEAEGEEENFLMLIATYYILAHRLSFRVHLVGLLLSKGMDYVGKWKGNSNSRVRDIDINVNISEMIKVNDDPTSHLNKPKIFEEVNNILQNYLIGRSHVNMGIIDYDKAIRELKKIQKELKLEEGVDNFKDI